MCVCVCVCVLRCLQHACIYNIMTVYVCVYVCIKLNMHGYRIHMYTHVIHQHHYIYINMQVHIDV